MPQTSAADRAAAWLSERQLLADAARNPRPWLENLVAASKFDVSVDDYGTVVEQTVHASWFLAGGRVLVLVDDSPEWTPQFVRTARCETCDAWVLTERNEGTLDGAFWAPQRPLLRRHLPRGGVQCPGLDGPLRGLVHGGLRENCY